MPSSPKKKATKGSSSGGGFGAKKPSKNASDDVPDTNVMKRPGKKAKKKIEVGTKEKVNIVWFRRNLRVTHDNTRY